jgi:ABC-2 type transport system permease protein
MMGFWDLVRLELRTSGGSRHHADPVWRRLLLLLPLPPALPAPIAREEPVVVVNEDGSQLSRQLEFMADATRR